MPRWPRSPESPAAQAVVLAVLLTVLTIHVTLAGPATTTPAPGDGGAAEDKFLYFAYGSNLLAERIHMQNPSARLHGIGKLQDFRLDFSLPTSSRWGGAPATVVPDPGDVVWGAIWSLDVADRDHLDEQEGVKGGVYVVFSPVVEIPGGGQVLCRCYRMRQEPAKLPPGEQLPAERQPSRVYKQVILAGAHQSGLPDDYIRRLQAIPDNGSTGSNPPIALESLPTVPVLARSYPP